MMKNLTCLLLLCICFLTACNTNRRSSNGSKKYVTGTFGHDLLFLKKEDSSLVVLKNKAGNEMVIVSPKYQAKVFTSTASGMHGYSFGWINYKSFSGPLNPQINEYGGENRFWLGPEGGRYSLFFKPDSSMVFKNWHTPPPFDSQPWSLVSKDDSNSVTMHKNMTLENYRGTELSIAVDRKVLLLNKATIEQQLQIPDNDAVSMVGYETDQTITNTGNFAWNEKTGMPCIWILDMFAPSPDVVIAIPFKPLKDKNKRIATSDYFGKIPSDRLIFKDSILYFKADGKSRGKLGLPPYRAKGIEGSYDATNHALTILTTDILPNAKYLYQKWDTAGATYDGDALNAYNDGPLANGSQLGPFYEMESVSPAAFLKQGASLSHRQSVYHFRGEKRALSAITKKLLGVPVDSIEDAFSNH